jgi:hypothetical protein
MSGVVRIGAALNNQLISEDELPNSPQVMFFSPVAEVTSPRVLADPFQQAWLGDIAAAALVGE